MDDMNTTGQRHITHRRTHANDLVLHVKYIQIHPKYNIRCFRILHRDEFNEREHWLVRVCGFEDTLLDQSNINKFPITYCTLATLEHKFWLIIFNGLDCGKTHLFRIIRPSLQPSSWTHLFSVWSGSWAQNFLWPFFHLFKLWRIYLCNVMTLMTTASIPKAIQSGISSIENAICVTKG